MATFEGKAIGPFELLLEEEQAAAMEVVTADKLMAENPDFFTSLAKAKAEVTRLRFIARAYRAWERNNFATLPGLDGDYIL